MIQLKFVPYAFNKFSPKVFIVYALKWNWVILVASLAHFIMGVYILSTRIDLSESGEYILPVTLFLCAIVLCIINFSDIRFRRKLTRVFVLSFLKKLCNSCATGQPCENTQECMKQTAKRIAISDINMFQKATRKLPIPVSNT